MFWTFFDVSIADFENVNVCWMFVASKVEIISLFWNVSTVSKKLFWHLLFIVCSVREKSKFKFSNEEAAENFVTSIKL